MSHWKEEIPQAVGRTLTGILDGAKTGAIKAFYVVGENPVGTLPPVVGCEGSIGSVASFLCVRSYL